MISTAWHTASTAAGGGATAVPYPFDTQFDLTDVWSEGCGAVAYINSRDCDARQSGSSSGAEHRRLAAQEVSDHFPLELTLCVLGDGGGSSNVTAGDPVKESSAGGARNEEATMLCLLLLLVSMAMA